MIASNSRDLAFAYLQSTTTSHKQDDNKKRSREEQQQETNNTSYAKKTKFDQQQQQQQYQGNGDDESAYLTPIERYLRKQQPSADESHTSSYGGRGGRYNGGNNRNQQYNNNNNNWSSQNDQYYNDNNYGNYNNGYNNYQEDYYGGDYGATNDNYSNNAEDEQYYYNGDEQQQEQQQQQQNGTELENEKDMVDVKQDNIWIMSAKKLPLEETSLHQKVVDVLQKSLNVTELFAVQRAVVPVAIAMTQSQTPGDICISSPTGSGKTLSYVLPIQQCCVGLKLTKLRAMVIVPSKTLARQVFNIFKQFAKVTGVSVELCDGSLPSFEQEQKKIITRVGDGYSSLTQVIIGTPNRLLRHVRDTKGFLQIMSCLKFIVLDEVDTMLDNSARGNSLKQLLAKYEEQCNSRKLVNDTNVPLPVPYIHARKILCSATLTPHAGRLSKLNLHRPQFFTNMLKHTPLAPAVAQSEQQNAVQEKQENEDQLLGTSTTGNDSNIIQDDESTRDQKYSVPDTLRQYVSTYDPYYKPLFLVALLLHPNLQLFAKQRKMLCFCDTPENASRLNVMLNSFLKTGAWQKCIEINEAIVAEKRRIQNQPEIDVYQGMATPTDNYKISAVYDAKMRAKDRTKLLKDFQSGAFSIMICTDVLGRGVDLEVDTVINYDTPSFLKAYMHRVGRTARAGKLGVALTMVEKNEKDIFKQKLTKRVSMKEPVSDYLVSGRVVEQMKGLYKEVLSEYKISIKHNNKGL